MPLVSAQKVRQELEAAVTAGGLEERVAVCEVGCMRLCCEGPLVRVEPESTLYQKVTPAQAPSIIHALNGGQAEATAGSLSERFLHAADLGRAGEQRHRGTRADRVVHRRRRLPGAEMCSAR